MSEPDTPPLERERELGVIVEHLDRACDGDGSLVVVEGPAGIGKTTLLQSAMEQGRRRGMNVMDARGGVLELELEYGVARQLIEEPILHAPAAVRERLLAGPAAPAGAVFGLSELPADSGPGYDPSPDILHALHWVVSNLAEPAPLLIVLDDAQWGDVASLRAGAYLARRLDGLAVTMLIATRGAEPGSHGALLTELLAAAEPEYVRPAPLTDAAVAEVVARAFAGQRPPSGLVAACRQAWRQPVLRDGAGRRAGRRPRHPQDIPARDRRPHRARGGASAILVRLHRLGPEADAGARGGDAGRGGRAAPAAAIAGLDPQEGRRGGRHPGRGRDPRHERPLRMVHALVRAAISEDTPRRRARPPPPGAGVPARRGGRRR